MNSDYSWYNKLTDTAPQLGPASYRFTPSTGAVHVVNDDLEQPHGIAISPDAKTIYISDTGAESAPISNNSSQQIGASFNPRGKRAIYAFNVSTDASYLFNKRPVYLSQDWVPDGLKVAANGYIVAGTGRGVDVLDEQGTPIVRVQTNYTVQNFAWAGQNLTEFWLMGQGGVSRVRWNLAGQGLTKNCS